MTDPKIIDVTAQLELRDFAPHEGKALYGVLCGEDPSGSIKGIGLSYVLREATASRAYVAGMPLAEFSSGSMARSLAHAATERGVEAFISFPGVTQAAVSAICSPFPATALAVDPIPAEHPLLGYFAAFRRLCRERGLFYPDQAQNPLFRAGYARWVRGVRELACAQYNLTRITSLVACVGTGSTLMGCAEGLRRHEQELHVVGVEPAPRSEGFPPWQDIPGLRNTQAFHFARFGQPDCYAPHEVDQRIELTVDAARAMRERLQACGIRAGLSAGAALQGALLAARSRRAGQRASETTEQGASLVILADARQDV